MRRRYVEAVPLRHVRLSPPDGPEIRAALDELRRELDISIGFPHGVLADADKSVRSLRLPDADETAIPFGTCISLRFGTESLRRNCRHFQPAASLCRRFVKTFNPKVAGSIPARPSKKNLENA